ncbi:hypothetical protein NIES4101_42040 [Calothrix sp. NIES-4101]|nr:hypothetical protein NIES4101_42040 [Calothrix sp. NIES-4101]
MPSTKAIELLYCCSDSQKDEELQQRLEKHLSLMKRQKVINTWHKGMTGAGEEWEKEITTRLNTADMILLLISSDLIYSDYHWEFLVQRAMKLHENRQARVIAILLCPYDNWKSEFGNIKILPHDNKPVSKWKNYDHAFESIARGIREEAKALTDPYFPLKKSFKIIGAGVKSLAQSILGNTSSTTYDLLSSRNGKQKFRRQGQVSLIPVIGIIFVLALFSQLRNLSTIHLSESKSRTNLKSKQTDISTGWIQLGVINKALQFFLWKT